MYNYSNKDMHKWVLAIFLSASWGLAATASLSTPRFSHNMNKTRVVFDLPTETKYTLTPTALGLRIDFVGAQSSAFMMNKLTPELLAWEYTPNTTGVTALLSTPFPLTPKKGWLFFELPPQGTTPKRLVIELGTTLSEGSEEITDFSSINTTLLGTPRFGQSPGNTRVVLDLPADVTYQITPIFNSLKIQLKNVSSPLINATLNTPELLDWRYEPSENGVTVTLRTPYLLSERSGHKILFLPSDYQNTQNRLVIDFSPAFADLTPLLPIMAALPKFPLPVRVVLDPGHGGNDPGTIGSVTEKEVTLDVSRRVQALLQAAGAEVILTRTIDTQLHLNKNIDLSTRAAFGNPPSQALVSIHVNAMEPRNKLRGYGVETWWFPNTSQSAQLANALQNNVLNFTAAASKGLKSTPLAVLKRARVPAALIEIGYTSHPIDGQNLLSSHYLDRVAAGIAHGIYEFLVEGKLMATQSTLQSTSQDTPPTKKPPGR